MKLVQLTLRVGTAVLSLSMMFLWGCASVTSDVYTRGAVQSAYRSDVKPVSAGTASELTLQIEPFIDIRSEKEDVSQLWKCAVPLLSLHARWDRPDWLNWDPIRYSGYKPMAQDLTELVARDLKKMSLFRSVDIVQPAQGDLILKGVIEELTLSLRPHFCGVGYFPGQFFGVFGMKLGDWTIQQQLSLQLNESRTGKVVWKKQYKTSATGALAMYYGRNPIAHGYPAEQLVAPVLKDFTEELRILSTREEIRALARIHPVSEDILGAPGQKTMSSVRPVSQQPLRPGVRSRWAVVIGISSYRVDSGLNNLQFADQDAVSFAERLKASGWTDSSIRLLVNEEATKRTAEIALESWLSKAGPDDLVVLYWAGHGFPDPEDPEKVYFACYDTDMRIPATGFRMDRVIETIKERNVRNVIVLADTCHAGKLLTRSGERGMAVIPGVTKMQREQSIPKGWIFMLGADADRQAIEHTSWRNGAFTHCLLKALDGEADGFQSIGSKDGIVSMGELRAYMETVMPDETQRVLGAAKRPVIATSSGDPAIWNLSF